MTQSEQVLFFKGVLNGTRSLSELQGEKTIFITVKDNEPEMVSINDGPPMPAADALEIVSQVKAFIWRELKSYDTSTDEQIEQAKKVYNSFIK